MTLIRWRQLQNSGLDNFPRTLLEPWTQFYNQGYNQKEGCDFKPVVNIGESETGIALFVELAGLTREDIKLNVSNNLLTITGERHLPDNFDSYSLYEGQYGSFCRTFTLADTVDPGGIEATMENGVLKIAIPKKEESLPRDIVVS